MCIGVLDQLGMRVSGGNPGVLRLVPSDQSTQPGHNITRTFLVSSKTFCDLSPEMLYPKRPCVYWRNNLLGQYLSAFKSAGNFRNVVFGFPAVFLYRSSDLNLLVLASWLGEKIYFSSIMPVLELFLEAMTGPSKGWYIIRLSIIFISPLFDLPSNLL